MDGLDEHNCNNTITATPQTPPSYPCPELTCPGTGKCYSYSEKCDNIPDCDDRSDEKNCPCNQNEFSCFDHQLCINVTQRCDGYYDCKDFSDEQNCFGCSSEQFTCSNGSCATKCNHIPECSDGADEWNCRDTNDNRPNYGCRPYQWRCDDGQCISQYDKCNGRADCRDFSDEANCHTETSDSKACDINMFRCENGPCIPIALKCNGHIDCPFDTSDELDCEYLNEVTTNRPIAEPQLNLRTYPSNQIIKESREVVFRCRDEGATRALVKWSRPNGRPLPPGAVDIKGRLEIPHIRMEDGGDYLCEAVGYPAYTNGQNVLVHLNVEKSWGKDKYQKPSTKIRYGTVPHIGLEFFGLDNPIADRPPSACKYHQATCSSNECIDKNQICDGIAHCSDGSDEFSCSHGRKCYPNQFTCKNTKCVDRIWRCDGENDCGDNSDEESCDPNPSGAPCRYDEYQCRSGHCVPKSFHCDGTNDCHDGSDEIGCIEPSVIRPPPPRIDLMPGAALNITCRGTGIPVPLIVWRLNWGHVPDKCESKTFAGFGNLYCPNMQRADNGAYSCEIINNKGTLLVSPDTIVTVIVDDEDVCPAGYFNALAVRRDDCINCFCFGVSNQCKSADLYTYALPSPITSQRVVGVEVPPNGGDVIINDYAGHDLINLRHGIQFRVSDVPYSRQQPYLELPQEYQGSQLKSYGGNLKYQVQYIGNGRPSNSPDVILIGNGYTLTHSSRASIEPNVQNQISVRFSPGEWEKSNGRHATREEIMMVLANIQTILIRLQYIESTEREVELTHIIMESAGADDRGLGSASLVEQCVCPTGYMGSSCETCAPGFNRQQGGAWLGRCVQYVPRECESGTYGDPNRGIPCRPCPCPLTNSGNNFARGCSLSSDGDVMCNCLQGYTGRRCEQCAQGYEGDPMRVGGSCHLRPVSQCDQVGTNYAHPDGSCECKALVVGPRCNTCATNSFHLNDYSYTGCSECFCMGVTKTCSSSTWYRDNIESTFSRSRVPHGFAIVADYESSIPTDADIEEQQNQLTYRVSSDTSDVLYWSLPPKFLGDKVTSYGGDLSYSLRYNPMPGGQMSRNTAPDIVLKSSNDIVIVHYRKNDVLPSISQNYSIPMIETSWQRNDGITINREHLLMALADVESILIKATYTTVTQEVALSHVGLDTAVRQNIGTNRAVEVEQCSCPPGYIGLSCEDCAPGFKRSQEIGLYLGICEPCECNGHSTECEPETGVCLNCRDNTMGEMCEECARGFNGNATIGSPNDCRQEYIDNSRICQDCDQRGHSDCRDGRCICKQNVIGARCDQCRPGTFSLDAQNADGCSECFCSGLTQSCSPARLYKQLIPLDFFENSPLITDIDGNVVDMNVEVDLAQSKAIYRSESRTQKYWSLSSNHLGNLIKSYGGNLVFEQEIESYQQYVPAEDVLLFGSGIKISWSRPRNLENEEQIKVRLHKDEEWYRQDRENRYRASKSDIMTVLANVDHILIRATTKIPTITTSISNILLETAELAGGSNDHMVTDVENCQCPRGYDGTSCETCAPLHYRNVSQTNYGILGACLPCPCGEETESCEMQSIMNSNVICHCKEGYEGDRCQHETSWEPTQRPTHQPPLNATISVRIVTPSISIIPIGGSIELQCNAFIIATRDPIEVRWYKLNDNLPRDAVIGHGYLFMQNLNVYDSGIYVCAAQHDSETVEQQYPLTIGNEEETPARPTVLIEPPYHDVEEFQSFEAYCQTTGSPKPQVSWIKVEGGPLPSDIEINGERFYIQSVRKSHEGAYRCLARNNVGTNEGILQIYVHTRYIPPPQPTRRPTSQPTRRPTPPAYDTVYIEPPSYRGRTGEMVRLNCQIRSQMFPEYQWLKDGYDLQRSRNVDINQNILIIRDATVQDSGEYECRVVDAGSVNSYSSIARVEIESNVLPPPDRSHDRPRPGDDPHVEPLQAEHQIQQGSDLTVTCKATGSPYPKITWTKLHESLDTNVQVNGNTLRIINAQTSNRGVYICVAESPSGVSDQSSTIIDVEPRERPAIEIYPQEPQSVRAGESAQLSCRAIAGIPDPRITWKRVDGRPLPTDISTEYEGTITIKRISMNDAGTYECVAENVAGRTTATTSINVHEPPIIQLFPDTPDIEVTEGEEFKLTCIATGTPTPTVEWDDIEHSVRPKVASFASHMPEAVIDISRITKNDAKLYTCTATSSAGTDRKYVSVRVKSRRGDTGIYDIPHPTTERIPTTTHSMNYFAAIGDEAKFSCDIGNEDVQMRIYWTRLDGRPLPQFSRTEGNYLILQRVSSDSAGVYRCNVIDHENGQPAAYFDANLILINIPHITFTPEMPMTVLQGQSVDIFCNASGEQPINIKWHAENDRLLPSTVRADGAFLRFYSIRFGDAGRYYCSASNRYGNATKVAEVVVNHSQTVHDRPPNARRQEIQEGQDVALNCDFDESYRRAGIRFVWRRNGSSLISPYAIQEDNRLLLRQVRLEDEGDYICEIVSPSGILARTAVELVIKHIEPTILPAKTIQYICQPNDFKCKSHSRTCIKPNRVCDGIYDCIDHSDELYCELNRHQLNSNMVTSSVMRTTKGPIKGGLRSSSLNKNKYRKIKRRVEPLLLQQQQQQQRQQHQKQQQLHQQVQQNSDEKDIQKKLWKKDNNNYRKIIFKSATNYQQPDDMLERLPILKLDQQSSLLRVGESTEVECYTSDSTYPDVIWERADERPLPYNVRQIGNKLIISQADLYQAGEYVCKCRTDKGDLYTTSYDLTVEEDTKRQWKKPKVEHVEVGSSVQLNCDVDQSSLSIRWSRQYGQMQPGKDLHANELRLNDVQARDAGTYICSVNSNGETIDNPTILVVTGAIPHFHQAPRSYMSFPVLESPYMKFNFEITFRPEQPDGLILYNGQKKGSGDYIALSLNNHYPEFRFDFGNKPTIIRAEKPIKLGEWHTIKVSRIRRDGYVIVDDQPPVAFPPASTTGLDLVEDLLIGGAARWEDLVQNAVEKKIGFVGCISRLVLQDKTIELIKDAKYKEGITSCEPCAEDPCQNDGICLESQTENGFACVCQEGFTGKDCSIEGTSCTPGICGSGRCENTNIGMECFCPMNKTGDRCQYIEHLDESILSFKDGSYAAYKTPRPSKLNIKFHVKPTSLNDSVILYVAESEHVNGDFVAVLIKDKHIELRINTGARVKPVIVTSLHPIQLNKWTEVEVGRRVGEGILKVGNEPEQTGKASGPARSLYLKTHLYVGGYDKRILLNRDVEISRGFDGCISHLEESSRKINLIAEILDAANIQNCGDNEISPNEIIPMTNSPIGKQDNYQISGCARDPCENYADCIDKENNQYQCNCPLGFSGKHCEEHVQLDSTASFKGTGYLELNHNVFSEEVNQLESFIAILFETTSPNGLLFWWGQDKGEPYNGQDFISLAVVDGILEYSFRLDGEENSVHGTFSRVDNGSRHVAIVRRHGNEVSLELDHLIEHGETKRPTARKTMQLPGHVFIGGAPDLATFTGNRFTNSFNGCIRVVEAEEGGPINLGQHAVSAINVDSCPRDDDDNGTEPPVV